MNKENITRVKENQICTGCGACNHVCPVSAIRMSYSPVGRLFPSINSDSCIQCGLCLRICPGIDITRSFSKVVDISLIGEVRSTYLAKSNDKQIFDNSQSGGCVTESLVFLLDKELIEAALVVGQKNQRAIFRVVTTREDLLDSQSSQYTPVDLISGLSLLEGYQHVALVGLPCHIEAVEKLREAFPGKYKNIDYLLGLICAGCVGQSLFDIVRNISGTIRRKRKIETISWRQKKYSSYNNSRIAVVSENGSYQLLSSRIRHIAKQYLTPPRCHLCFDKMNLMADIVYGDCWGIVGADNLNGANVILTRSERGDSLVSDMVKNNYIKAKNCSVDEIERGQVLKNKLSDITLTVASYKELGLELPSWAELFDSPRDTVLVQSAKTSIQKYLSIDETNREYVVRSFTHEIRKQFLYYLVSSLWRRIKVF